MSFVDALVVVRRWEMLADADGAHEDREATALMARTGSQRAFDALVQVFIDAASTPAGGRAPEPVVNIVIDQARFEQAVRDAAGDRTPVGRPADPRWQRPRGGVAAHLVVYMAWLRGRSRALPNRSPHRMATPRKNTPDQR